MAGGLWVGSETRSNHIKAHEGTYRRHANQCALNKTAHGLALSAETGEG